MFQVDSQRPAVTIAAFNHGTFNPKKKKKIKFTSFKQDDGKKRKRFLVGRTDTCCYVGKNFEEMFSSSKMCSHYVGVLNKSTGKIQICDADLFCLNPNFPQAQQEREENPNLSQFEKRNRLIEAFGGKRAKQLIENRQRNIVQGDVLKDAIDGALEETMKPENAKAIEIRATVEESAVFQLLPPCDLHATSVHDVYKFDDIINPVDMAQLSEHSQDIFDVKPEEVAELMRKEIYCQFVLEHLLCLPNDLAERQKMANCLLYFEYLVQLYKMKAGVIKSKEIFTVFPDFLVKSFTKCSFLSETKNFRGHWERRCSSCQKDKIAVHLIVLALLMDDFKTSVRTIMTDLKMGRVKVLKLFGYIGCRIIQEKGEKEFQKQCAVLKVPLQLKVVAKRKLRNS